MNLEKTVSHGVYGVHALQEIPLGDGVKTVDCRFVDIHPLDAFRTGPGSPFLRALRVLRGYELRFLG
jgi:hypothetical protein